MFKVESGEKFVDMIDLRWDGNVKRKVEISKS